MPRKPPATPNASPKASSKASPPADAHELRFSGPIERKEMGAHFHIVEVPIDVEQLYGVRGYLRMVGTVNGHPVERALVPGGSGRHFIVIGGDLRRTLGLRLGHTVDVVLRPDTRPPDQVDTPEELAEALALEPGARARYDALTPGLRRSLHIYIHQAKRPETRAKRAVELAQKIATNNLYSQRRKPTAGADPSPDETFDAGSF